MKQASSRLKPIGWRGAFRAAASGKPCVCLRIALQLVDELAGMAYCSVSKKCSLGAGATLFKSRLGHAVNPSYG